MRESLERLARNQALFREVNERLLEVTNTVSFRELSTTLCARTRSIS
jgi:hypothetical protein